MMLNIYLNGKSGFIGGYLETSLLKSKYRLLDNPNKCNIWILMAGRMGNEDMQENINDNFLLNINLLKSAKIFPGKIIYISSIDIYDLDTYYAAAKLASENFLRIFCKENKIKLIILRPSQVYGPKDRGNKVIPKFIEKISKNEKIEIYKKGQERRKYLYVSDLIEAILKLLRTNTTGTFDLVGKKTIKIIDVVKTIEKITGKKAKIRFGFNPKVDFDKGIKLTIKSD